MSIHWQDPDETLYNQPACGGHRIAPCAADIELATCPMCKAIRKPQEEA